MKPLLPTLAVLALASPTLQADDEYVAWVVTQTAKPTECLAPVAIQQIDGQERSVSSQAFKLEPGLHSMHGRARIDTRHCPVVRGSRDASVPPLEAVFEAGKRYYVAFDHSSPNREDWALVIWKVEDMSGGG